jgi:hypothetical protein
MSQTLRRTTLLGAFAHLPDSHNTASQTRQTGQTSNRSRGLGQEDYVRPEFQIWQAGAARSSV